MYFHKLTEEEAQTLSNLIQMYIAVDKNGSVSAFKREPIVGKKQWFGHKDHFARFCDDDHELPVRIKSEKIWSERLFKPCRLINGVTDQQVGG